MPLSFFIETVGCQMNVLDSELLAAELRRHGYEQAESLRRADGRAVQYMQRFANMPRKKSTARWAG